MPSIKKIFDLIGDGIVEVSTTNKSVKNKKRSYDEKWLEESKAKLLKQFDDEKSANSFMARIEKRIRKQ